MKARRLKSRNKINIHSAQVDRRAFSVTSSFDDADVTRYWHAQTPQARLRYMEELRRMNYGNLATRRMKRVLEIVERD
jgi:hypothetical protein